jgi:ERCC4-related helicase
MFAISGKDIHINMQITDYQAQYYSYQLTRRRASDDAEKLGTALFDAKVDLNPHQIEAALFAFHSPLSNGAILADEVGLGKTIEAGILLSQFWATEKKKLLIICPSSLRKQWSQELSEKFYLQSEIIEAKRFNDLFKAGKRNPFELSKVVICSFHFAKNKADYIQRVDWDLVVMDEAHRLRNVYKPSNVIGKAIKDAIYTRKKILLTATPLQNHLMELFGLVSIIDEKVFGNSESFRSQFTRVDEQFDYTDLKDRISPVLKRTLRRQVQEYIRYTRRVPITITFEPNEQEQELYDKVSTYLQRSLLHALPSNQRHLLTLIIRKLLASSSFAIAATLDTLIKRLERVLDQQAPDYFWDQSILEDIDEIDDLLDEWDLNDDGKANQVLKLEEANDIKRELDELKQYRDLALSIEHNAKGEKLFAALQQGFEKLNELGAARKAIIFTESRRTQEYLFNLFQQTDFKDKVIYFNGTNNDELSKKIYRSWYNRYQYTDKCSGSKTADKRQAIVDYFKDHAEIMIATEAAAEGINLQFCSMIINYDLPWNPQRVEQRIGRCHRYGQKHDVVVANFLNASNAADQRVYQLLDQKFNLFSGVFGVSDDVLGTLESGVDFEKAIVNIYQTCRTTKEINVAFDSLQKEMETTIASKLKTAQEKLLEHFDAEVVDKLKTRLKESKAFLGKFERWLWLITKLFLNQQATFDDRKLQFHLSKSPFTYPVKTGTYSLDKKNESTLYYRLNHPLSKGILKHYRELSLPVAEVVFNLSGNKSKVSLLEKLKGKSGWLTLDNVEVNSFELTDHLLFTAITTDGELLRQEQCLRMMELPTTIGSNPVNHLDQKRIESAKIKILEGLRTDLKNKDIRYLQHEVSKLNKWADDRILLVEKELRDIKMRIKELTRLAAQTSEPVEQLEIQKKLKELEKKQRKQRQLIFDAEDQIVEQRDQMIEEIEKRMMRNLNKTHIFTIHWNLI